MKSKLENWTKEEVYEKFNSAITIDDFFRSLGYSIKTSVSGKTVKYFKKIYPELNLSDITNRYIKYEDLTGQTFGNLEVLYHNDERSKKEKKTFWVCKCLECGNLTTVWAGNLKNGHTTSCGCIKYKEREKEDLTGQTFGFLLVKELDIEKSKKYKRGYWRCECQCGKIISVNISNLKNGNSMSCGCLRISKGELKIRSILDELNIPFETQKTFDDLVVKRKLSYDFYLPLYNCCIEFQGKQHYQPIDYFGGEEHFKLQQSYDDIKKRYCLEKSIHLIEIPYTEEHLLSKEYILEKLQERGIKYEKNA